MEKKLDIDTIFKKAIHGAFSLTLRRILLLVINFVSLNIVLAKVLPVSTLGIFIIANSILAFFTFFSDVGLAAALIRKAKLLPEDLKTTFTIQEILALIITAVVFFLAPLFAKSYNLNVEGVWLIRALAISFFLTSLKVIPSVILERNLRFGKLVWVEVIETLAFNGALIILVFNNFNIAAFTWSTILRSTLGVAVIYIIAPWKIGFGFSKASAKELLQFGVPFQLNSFLALLKDQLVPLVIAGIVGSIGVGYISQGKRIALFPLEIMNIVTRVTFPTFSRLQNDPAALKTTLEKSLFATAVFLYPMLFGVIAISPSLVKFLGEEKWGPVLPLIYLFAITAFWATLSSPFTNFLNAIGRVNVTLKLMVMWTILEWGLAPFFTIKYGFIGMGISSALISFTSVIPLIIIKRMVSVGILENIWQPIIASVAMSVLIFYLNGVFPPELPTILLLILIGSVIYFTILFILAKDKIRSDLKGLKDALSS